MQLVPVAEARREHFSPPESASPLAAVKRRATPSRRALSLVRNAFRDSDASSPFSLQSPLEALREALKAQAAVLFVPELTSRGWELSLCQWAGPRSLERGQQLRRFVRSAGLRGAAFGAFDPFAVERDQRNCAWSGAELEATIRATHRGRRLRTALGWPEHDQLRVLICDGVRLVAWLGVLRSEPFSARELALFRCAVKPFSARLQREHARSRNGAHQLVDALLETFREPAFVLSEHGRIEYANRVALAWLDRPESASEVATLRRALAQDARHPTFSLQRLALDVGPPFTLARRVKPQAPSARVVARACQRFELGDTDRRVVQELCAGRSNKEIAAGLGTSEVTVERRLTRLYQLTCSHGRTELLARIYGS